MGNGIIHTPSAGQDERVWRAPSLTPTEAKDWRFEAERGGHLGEQRPGVDMKSSI